MTDISLPLTSTASCVQVCLFGGREERIVAKMIDTQSAVSTIHQLYVPTSQVYSLGMPRGFGYSFPGR